MFATVVSKFVPGQVIDPNVFKGKEWYLYADIKRVIPELFVKQGRSCVFVGSVSNLLSREDEITSMLRERGMTDPTTSTPTRVISAPPVIDNRTDEEIAAWINDVFSSLTLLSNAAANLKIRSMIVSGTPGTGKSYEVQKAMLAKTREHKEFYYSIIKGTISPIRLYMELYHARNGVLILDDCDEAFTDQESMQLLKAATESSKHRTIDYRKLSKALEDEGIPSTFEFNGCVVVLTNTNLEDASKGKRTHYEAIMSRAHYINAVLATDREKLIRIRHVISSTNLLDDFLPRNCHQAVVDFIDEHHHRARELSIRTVVKIAELKAAYPEQWLTLARGTLLVK